ncbi:unnamed protein product [Bursaphelenchus okinawaensis]|uniref:Skp1-related protein n=1 Tax=Bursaphelenchus okinawaensis TaxID=465554 RepID=A0A811L0Y6_9BILA|nr:unnamed protein product [Bursaphelenchus okinawaensis]CAG9115527.1 unnamed protein product [Bursaphelenchus okinawaensis]
MLGKEKVVLKSSDGIRFSVDCDSIRHSKLLYDMMACLRNVEHVSDTNDEEVPREDVVVQNEQNQEEIAPGEAIVAEMGDNEETGDKMEEEAVVEGKIEAEKACGDSKHANKDTMDKSDSSDDFAEPSTKRFRSNKAEEFNDDVAGKTKESDSSSDEDSPGTSIPIKNVKSDVLEKVLHWCEYHKEDEPLTDEELKNKDRNVHICAWDAEYLKMDDQLLLEVIKAANYLDIQELLDITCKHVANKLKDKSPEEIRAAFNIENDFSPEEEAKILKDNALFDD